MSADTRRSPPPLPTHAAEVATKPSPTAAARNSTPIAQTLLSPNLTRDWRRSSIVTIASLALHLLALGAMGLIAITTPKFVEELFTTIMDEEPMDPISERSLVPIESPIQMPENAADLPLAESSQLDLENTGPLALNFSDGDPQIRGSLEVSASSHSSPTDLMGVTDIKLGNEMSGRMSAAARGMLVKKYGGTTASEAAVVAGLNWLASHQFPNGSWSFDHGKHPNCKGQCSQSGHLKNCPNGATALAILTFLGAGHTQFAGNYQPQVKKGLEFLLKAGTPSAAPKGLDFRGQQGFGIEGMYVQGLCAIALSECAVMTSESRIRNTAKGAIEFIVNTQNRTDGGWRYHIGQPGDTSVVGWQVMALKSAVHARIDVPHRAFQGVQRFLDSAQTNRGMNYVYTPMEKRGGDDADAAMTAVGLLCRMYLGWDRNDPQLAAGVKYLAGVKPLPHNMYFNYYATQVMHHWGGDDWTKWNEAMREQLIRSQHAPRSGHVSGSWDLADDHGPAGGRLYMTCLATMTLEVYYRHLPLYDREKLKVEF